MGREITLKNRAKFFNLTNCSATILIEYIFGKSHTSIFTPGCYFFDNGTLGACLFLEQNWVVELFFTKNLTFKKICVASL